MTSIPANTNLPRDSRALDNVEDFVTVLVAGPPAAGLCHAALPRPVRLTADSVARRRGTPVAPRAVRGIDRAAADCGDRRLGLPHDGLAAGGRRAAREAHGAGGEPRARQ